MEDFKLLSYLQGINEPEKALLLEKLRDSIYNTEKYILSITKWIFGLSLLYFLFGTESLRSVNFLGAEIELDRVIDIIAPVGMSLLILFYVLSALHKYKCVKSYRLLFESVFGYPKDDDALFRDISNQTLPLPILNNLIIVKGFGAPTGCLRSIFIGFPIATIQIVPYLFIFYALNIVWTKYWELVVARFSFFFSIYFILLGIYLFVRHLIEESRKQILLKELSTKK